MTPFVSSARCAGSPFTYAERSTALPPTYVKAFALTTMPSSSA